MYIVLTLGGTLAAQRLWVSQQGIQTLVADPQERQVEILCQQPCNLVSQHGLVPVAKFRELVVGNSVGPALRLVEMAEPDHRHLGQPQEGCGKHPAMSRNQLAVVRDHARDRPAELRHAGRDLGHLVIRMDLGIAGIGAQPIDRPGLDLARSEDNFHECSDGAGRAPQQNSTIKSKT